MIRGMDLMDDMPLPYHDHNHHNSPMSPINLNLMGTASTAVPNPSTQTTTTTAQPTPGTLLLASSGTANLLDPNSTFHKSLAAATSIEAGVMNNGTIGAAGLVGGKGQQQQQQQPQQHLACCNSLFLNDLRQTAGADMLMSDTGVAVPLNNNLPSGLIINTNTDTEVLAGNVHSTKSEKANRNRWLECPELTKAMDGVTYIADHTRKEEESSRVSRVVRSAARMDTLYILPTVQTNPSVPGLSVLGEGGLEVRGHGAGSAVSVDLYDCGRIRNGRYHPAGTHALRYARADRHQDVGDRDDDRETVHRQAGALIRVCTVSAPIHTDDASPAIGKSHTKSGIFVWGLAAGSSMHQMRSLSVSRRKHGCMTVCVCMFV